MARKKQYQDLYVYMNGISVGKLVHESTGQLVFTYDHEWLNWNNSRPISLSMPLTEIPYKGYMVDCYFDNLLPDSKHYHRVFPHISLIQYFLGCVKFKDDAQVE